MDNNTSEVVETASRERVDDDNAEDEVEEVEEDEESEFDRENPDFV
jgi:hypothetical protein